MFTRCPNCDTHFEITQEYLDAAHGKVRCGQCDHVFNALDNLYENEESKADSETENKTDSPPPEQTENFFSGINIKEKMEKITASLSAATQEIKIVRTKIEPENPPAKQQTTNISDILEAQNSQDGIEDELPETVQTVNEEKPVENESNEIETVAESTAETIAEEDVNGEDNNESEDDEEGEGEDDFEIIDYNEEESDNEQSHLLIDVNTSKVNAADMDVLNSLMETPKKDGFDGFDNFNEDAIDTEADRQLLDNLDKISNNIPDSLASLDDELSSLNDDELSSLDDDFDNLDDLDELDDGDDLLAELDQIEHDILDKENHSRQKITQENTAPTPSYTDNNTSPLSEDSTVSTVNEEVVPSFLTQKDAPQLHPTAVFAWLAATIVFLFVLAGQYLYFNSKDFADNPQMHTIIKPFCQLTGCTLPLIKTPRKIVTVTHDVRSFGPIKNTLEIQLTFKNKASYTQSYPLLEITFLNPVGNVVARRKFSPAEYMSSADDYTQGLKSNQSQDINLKIVDPDPKSFLSFQFNYL